jgi:hypothetical protein
MRSALDDFEATLVNASRSLGAAEQTVAPTASSNGALADYQRSRNTGRMRRLLVAVPLAWIAMGAVALAATSGLTIALLFQGNSTKTIASFECATDRSGGGSGVPAVTGNPLIDCAASWPEATAGRSTAPPLTAWSAVGKTIDAVVQPTAWGPPTLRRLKTGRYTSVPVHWEKLPANWTVNLGVVELTDQLNAIPSGMSATLTCTYPNRAVSMVKALLVADHLAGWKIKLQALSGSLSSSCRQVIPNVDGGIRTVQLLEAGPVKAAAFGHLRPRTRALDREERAASLQLDHRLIALQGTISSTLARRCASVGAAAALWTTDASAAGFHATTPTYFRALNANRNPATTRFNYYYTLFRQPASQDTGSCAHVLVMPLGGGAILVYAARIEP